VNAATSGTLPADVRFPSLKAPQLLAVLQRKPLSYRVMSQTGSHRHLSSDAGYPDLDFSWHDNQTLPSGLVRRIFTKRIGLSEEDARKLL
jgi:predicted RNA binding protein YcfA (HicA-like mRNA interferase family)